MKDYYCVNVGSDGTGDSVLDIIHFRANSAEEARNIAVTQLHGDKEIRDCYWRYAIFTAPPATGNYFIREGFNGSDPLL